MSGRKRAMFPDEEDFVNMMGYPGPIEEGIVYAEAVRGQQRNASILSVNRMDRFKRGARSRHDSTIRYVVIMIIIVTLFVLFGLSRMV